MLLRSPWSDGTSERSFSRFVRCSFDGGELESNWTMVRWPSLQRPGVGTVKPSDKAAVQPKSKHVPGDMGGLTRPYVSETREERGPDRVVVADHCGWAFDRADDAQQLPAVEQLPVR